MAPAPRPAGDGPALSLVVATLGRVEPLARLLASLAVQDPAPFEVVVVDQNAPGTLEPLLAAFSDRLTIRHLGSAPGLSRARNVGIAAARAPLVAFPDDDCWYPPGLVARVVGLMDAHPDLAGISGRTTDAEGRDSVSPFGMQTCRVTRRNYLACGNSNGLFFRRAVFAAVGGFDERLGVGSGTPFGSGEEADVILRAVAADLAIQFLPDLVVHHDQVETDPVRTLARSAAYGAGFGALLAKHRFGAAYLGYRILRSAARMAATGLRSRALAAERWAWIAGMLRGYRGWQRLSL